MKHLPYTPLPPPFWAQLQCWFVISPHDNFIIN